MDALVVAMVSEVHEAILEEDEEVLEEDEKVSLRFITTTIKSQVIQSINAPSERETSERCACLCHYARRRANMASV